MTIPRRNRPGRPKKPRVRSRDIRGSKYVRRIRKLLLRLRKHRDGPNRLLHYDEYVAYVLLYFFNPVLTSMRGIQQASTLKAVQRRLKLPRFSLGSFSEAGRVFDPELLLPLIGELADEATDLGTDPRLSALDKVLTAVDGTLIRALPKMVWALWLDEEHRAAKMHLEYEVIKGAPVHATITDANTSEGHVLRANLAAGKLYTIDRGYATYALMADILDARSSFVVRLDNNAVYEVLEERPVSKAARKAGIHKDLIVKLGSKGAPQLHDRRIRLIEIHVRDTDALVGRKRRRRTDAKTKAYRKEAGNYTILLATDLLDLDVELVADLFRYRWQIELFFRWFKTVLGADHLLSLTKNGLAIVAYCALIASLLITVWTGRKPTKRTYEMLCLYFAGWADEEELEAHIDKLAPALD